MVLSTETEDPQRAIDIDIAKHQADIEKYQAAIEKHRTAILALKFQRNRLAFISQLPPEILSRIISFLKAAYYPYNSLAWIKATHVSTHWREVAMDSPTLWDDPPLGKVEWQQEMLRRSKTASLTIKTDVSYGPVSFKKTGLRDILRNHGSRIKHLVITGVDLECLKILEDLPVSTSCLETLYLHAAHSLGVRGDVFIPNRTLTDSKKLRRLQLHRLPGLDFLRWDLFFLSNITHLELSDTAESASLTWRQFMSALKQMTKLEQLGLGNFIDSTTEDDTPSLGLVSLRCLERLDMNCPTGAIATFFRYVTFPPSANVDVVATSRFGSISETTSTISNIARLYSDSTPDLEFQSLSMVENDYASCFALYRQTIEKFHVTMDYPVLSLNFNTSDIVPTASIVSAIFSGEFPLNKVSHVRIYTYSVSPDTLAHTIGTLPALSLIKVEDLAAVPFLKALCLRRNAVDVFSFANLVSIRLEDVAFKGEKAISEDDLDLELLKDCLKQRQKCGAEIQKLVLMDCFNLKAADVLELQAIVADVDWDEEENVEDDDANDSDSTTSDEDD